MHIELQKASLRDKDDLVSISRKTFYDAFAALNTPENMQLFMEDHLTDLTIVSELQNEHSEFYFAVSDHEKLGYIKLNYSAAQTEIQDHDAMEIERIYVLQQHQGKNIGRMMFAAALSIAKSKQLSYIWLGVWEHNHKAINFYKRLGFAEFDKHSFALGNDVQTDIMMKLLI